MGSAEEAIRRRQQEVERHQAAADRADAARKANARMKLCDEVDSLVPAALAGLERAGWPGGRLLEVQGRWRTKRVAGWPVGGYRFRNKEGVGPDRVNPVYLLSTGQWLYHTGGKPQTFRSVVAEFAGGTQWQGSLLTSELPDGVTEELRRLAALPPGAGHAARH